MVLRNNAKRSPDPAPEPWAMRLEPRAWRHEPWATCHEPLNIGNQLIDESLEHLLQESNIWPPLHQPPQKNRFGICGVCRVTLNNNSKNEKPTNSVAIFSSWKHSQNKKTTFRKHTMSSISWLGDSLRCLNSSFFNYLKHPYQVSVLQQTFNHYFSILQHQTVWWNIWEFRFAKMSDPILGK